MQHSLPILNLEEARYECTFGRGCDGVCCREGNPIVYPEEVESLKNKLPQIMPMLRRAAQAIVRRKGFLRTRRRLGLPTVRNAEGWCVFFNQGCVLHRLGEEEGNKFLYKPAVCSLFPIQTDENGIWYIRQHGYKKEKWDLFCLCPANSAVPAEISLREELALAQHFEDQYQARQPGAPPATSPNR